LQSKSGSEAPRFLAYPRTSTVQSGANAVLKWQVAGEPLPSIAWEKDGSELELPSGRMFVEANGDAYSLLVSQAGPADSGRYVCKAKNCVGETYAAATLKVEAAELKPKGQLDTQPPVFLNKPVSARVTQGEDVTFTCRVLGQLEWEKDGRKLSEIFESSHYKVDIESGDWHSLHIYSTRLPDAGVYVCRAQNSFGETMAAAVLLVDSVLFVPHDKSPNLLPSLPTAKVFTVNEGKHAKFRCYVTGKPKPEIVWQKDGKVLSPGRRHLLYEDREGYFILKVLYCTARDCGLYVCTACNTAGQTLSAVKLHVKEPRLCFQAPLVDVEVLERQDAVLECQVPLENIPTVWYLEDKRLQPSPKYLIEEQGLLRRLTVRDARTDDDGIYLCEMEGKGRSVGELSVQGLIVKRLPRKLDVMEGENAAFYVETREPVEVSSWDRNGQELVEAPHTLIRSFGKTHLLVLVHVSRHDAGVITFMAGESQTSAQLRVKCAKRIPPSAPVAVRMCTARSNAALLTWCPPPDVHRSPPSSYILERQTVGEAEWVPCLTTDVASMVEVPGDSVPQEADYRFRVCSANQYGCSEHVEFPGSVHLVSRARVQRGLQDVTVHVGEDATFSVQLSAITCGCWFLNGKRLEEEEEEEGQQYQITHNGVDHALKIRGVQLTASGSEVRFEANGVKEGAVLHVTGEYLVHITPVPEARRSRALLAGMPLLLECEVSIPDAPVCWFKEGNPVALDGGGLVVQSEGYMRKLLISSVCSSDSGMYTCDAGDDSISFMVTVDDEAHAYQTSERVVLVCELSRPTAPVRWYKDGDEVEESESLLLEHEGSRHQLVIASARMQDTGEFVCDIGSDSVVFKITVTGQWPLLFSCFLLVPTDRMTFLATEPPVRVLHSSAEEDHTYQAGERVVLSCELSRPGVPVHWYKDGEEVEESEGLLLESEGFKHQLVIPSAQVQDSGEFVCDAGGDSVFFNITVTEPPVQIVHSNADMAHTYQASDRVVLFCELSRPSAPVCWYKDGEELEEGEGLLFESEGSHRRLILSSARVQDTGEFVCDTGSDSAFFVVTIAVPEAQRLQTILAGMPLLLECEVSASDAPVQWLQDGEPVSLEDGHLTVQAEGCIRRLQIHSACPLNSGTYTCKTADDSVAFAVTVDEPPVRILQPAERSLEKQVWAFERLELSCQVSHATAPVRWFKDGLEVDETHNLLLQVEGAERRLVVLQTSAEDAGEYICETKDDSVSFDVRVSGECSPTLAKMLILPVEVQEGETMTLVARLSQEKASVQWMKNMKPLYPGPRIVMSSEGLVRSLTIRYVAHLGFFTRGKRAGYKCNAITTTILKFVRGLSDVSALQGETVLFWCELCKTKGDVVWLKDGQELEPSEHREIRAEGRERSLTLSHVGPEDAGEYSCESKDDRTLAILTVQSESFGEGLSGSTGALHAHSSKVNPQHLQRALGKPSNGLCHTLAIRHCRLSDTGIVTVHAEGLSSSARLSVQEPPVTMLRFPQDLGIPETGSATFECELSQPLAEVKWFKVRVGPLTGPNCRMYSVGRRRLLQLNHCSLEDAGEYTCDAGDCRASRKTVREERQVQIVRELEDVRVRENENAVFMCEVSLEDVKGEWFRDGERIKVTSTVKIRQEGTRHFLLLCCVRPEDAGLVRFLAKAATSEARLEVEALPIRIVKPLRDKTVLARHKATLECTVSQSRGRVRWFRGDKEIFAGPKYEICNLDCYRTLVIHSVEPADEGLYTCDALDDCSTACLLVEGKGEHVSAMKRNGGGGAGLVGHKGAGRQNCRETIRRGIVCWQQAEGRTKKECCRADFGLAGSTVYYNPQIHQPSGFRDKIAAWCSSQCL
uniref:Obscurin-like protein 1 n=1 Tax=Varanus komodoensis TaxID=61221 RepID=A0A8D2LTB0_VARKO